MLFYSPGKPCWDTRIAAAHAVEAILKNVPVWRPPAVKEDDLKKPGAEDDELLHRQGRLNFAVFNLKKVIQNGDCLMASEGKEFDAAKLKGINLNTCHLLYGCFSGLGTKERLAWQRMQLNKKLGLDVAAQLGFDSSTIFSNEDIEPGGEMEKEEEVSRISPLLYDVDQCHFDAKGEGRTKAQSLGDSC